MSNDYAKVVTRPSLGCDVQQKRFKFPDKEASQVTCITQKCQKRLRLSQVFIRNRVELLFIQCYAVLYILLFSGERFQWELLSTATSLLAELFREEISSIIRTSQG